MEGFAQRLKENVCRVLIGKEHTVELAITTLVAGGHLLIEDRPGVGKTLLARALARSLDVPFQRVQCTADMLPADILGAQVYHP
ncbi:MAG: AAA family ATPase, partial [Planctomycetota bacterium]